MHTLGPATKAIKGKAAGMGLQTNVQVKCDTPLCQSTDTINNCDDMGQAASLFAYAGWQRHVDAIGVPHWQCKECALKQRIHAAAEGR